MSIGSNWCFFTDEDILKTPTMSGIYALYEGDETIYIGKAEGFYGIRGRLQDHKAGREGSCTQRAQYFSYEICSSASVRERSELQLYKAIWGKLPRCNEFMP